VIRDASLFAFIAANVGKIVVADTVVLEELVARNVAIKAAIVAEDPFEHGVRALLNFGHTFGHAIETALNYSGISHGEAVSAGMTAASRLAFKRGKFPHEDLRRLLTLLDYVGLPTCCLNIDVDKVLAGMWTDKKVKSGQIRLILPTRIGHAEIVTGVSEGDLREAIESLRTPIVAEKRQDV
jgi:3-dehydroquinate synthase